MDSNLMKYTPMVSVNFKFNLPRAVWDRRPLTWIFRNVSNEFLIGRGVAQSGSALEWGSRGRRFKSSRPDQKL
jgi:hypothetical protein